ncbi:MAG: hypothetical protein H0X45_01945 [Planctomycetes bacterium]|nr:hypothetical protein [Planctomycetota bacterium]
MKSLLVSAAFLLSSIVTLQAAELAATPATVAPGAAITVSWSGIEAATNTDWIGLYAAGADDYQFQSWIYTYAAASGTTTFLAPTTPGSYDLRLFANDGYGRLASSGTVTVATADSETNDPIPGVVLSYGQINITATEHSHNVANLTTEGDQVRVSLNGRSVTFPTSEVSSFSYMSGAGGWDSFTDDTDLNGSLTMLGGHNSVIRAGGVFGVVYLLGNDNYCRIGGSAYVYSYLEGSYDPSNTNRDVVVPSPTVWAYFYDLRGFYFI